MLFCEGDRAGNDNAPRVHIRHGAEEDTQPIAERRLQVLLVKVDFFIF